METKISHSEETKETVKHYFTLKDIIFQGTSILLMYLLFRFTFMGFGGLWITFGTCCFCLTVIVYTKAHAIKFKWYDYTYLAYVLALGISFSLHDSRILMNTNLIFLLLSFYYWVITLSGSRESNRLDHNVLKDLFKGLVIYPFSKLAETTQMYKTTKKSKVNLIYIALGILISIPVFFIVIFLLGSADAAFQSLLFSVSRLLRITDNLFSLFLAFPIGYYFSLMIYRNMTTEPAEVIGGEKAVKQEKVQLDSLFLTVLAIFIPVYLLFFITSAVGYVDTQTVSARINLSSYARQGFFQLVIVSVINVGIFSVIKLFSSNSKVIKIGLTLIGLETLALIVMAFVKMQLYIQSYGLTVLRFNTSWFMIVLFVCVSIFTIGLWKAFNYIKGAVLFIALSVLVLSFRNVGNDIAAYNYNRFNQENLKEFDTSIFYSIGVEAVPTAINIYEEVENPILKEETAAYLEHVEYEITTGSKNQHTFQRSTALKEINAALK